MGDLRDLREAQQGLARVPRTAQARRPPRQPVQEQAWPGCSGDGGGRFAAIPTSHALPCVIDAGRTVFQSCAVGRLHSVALWPTSDEGDRRVARRVGGEGHRRRPDAASLLSRRSPRRRLRVAEHSRGRTQTPRQPFTVPPNSARRVPRRRAPTRSDQPVLVPRPFEDGLPRIGRSGIMPCQETARNATRSLPCRSCSKIRAQPGHAPAPEK